LLLISAKDFIDKNVQEAKITWKDCYENGDIIPFSELPMPASLQGIQKNNMEIYVERHDGSKRIELISGAPIYAEDGRLLAGIITMTDITDRKKAEIALQEKNEEYEVINEELRSTTEELQAQNEELQTTESTLRRSEERYRGVRRSSLSLRCNRSWSGTPDASLPSRAQTLSYIFRLPIFPPHSLLVLRYLLFLASRFLPRFFSL